MGFLKKAKKAVKRVGKAVGKGVKTAGRAAKTVALGGSAALLGSMKKPGRAEQELDQRSAAAAKLINKPVKRQAGQGQINYTGEFYE